MLTKEWFGLDFFDPAIFKGVLTYEKPVNLNVSEIHGEVTIGAYTYLNGLETKPTVLNNCKLGRYCSIAQNVEINPGQHCLTHLTTHPITGGKAERSSGLLDFPEYLNILPDSGVNNACRTKRMGDVEIGNDVWIGSHVVILGGVRIGDGAVIGAGSVVTKDVAPYMIVGGNPAKNISQRFDDGVVEELMKLQWWNYDIAPIKNQINFGDVNVAIDTIKNAITFEKIALKNFVRHQLKPLDGGLLYTNLDTNEYLKVEVTVNKN